MKRNRTLVFILDGIFILALLAGLFLVLSKRSNFQVKPGETKSGQQNGEIAGTQSQTAGPKSPISGLVCANANRRPFAVMLSGDTITRPLSGISQADMVFEMPVVQGGITRSLAVYVCESPTVIGSVRSARQDFIPLADGLNAIYAHWGGSHFALDILKNGVIDNLDALANPYNAFYRQSGIIEPHNGFTSMNRLLNAAQKLNYSLENKFVGYPHLSQDQIQNHGQESKNITVGYPSPSDVKFQYDPATNSYLRFRGDAKEMDRNTGKQVEAKNVVIMRAQTSELEGQYNTVQVTGTGKITLYLNGQEINGSWKKGKSDESKLFFYDDNDQEIKFVPGSIWVEIADPSIAVSYK